MFGDFDKIMKWNLVNVILILNILSEGEYLSLEVTIRRFHSILCHNNSAIFRKESVYYLLQEIFLQF